MKHVNPCWRFVRRATRPLRHHVVINRAIYGAVSVVAGCVGGPIVVVWWLPPAITAPHDHPTSIPEPATWLMLAFAAVCVGILSRYRSVKP